MVRSPASKKQFNQRRKGILKKANDLRKICGVNVALFIQDGDAWYTFKSQKDWPFHVKLEHETALLPDDFTTVREATLNMSASSSPQDSSQPADVEDAVSKTLVDSDIQESFSPDYTDSFIPDSREPFGPDCTKPLYSEEDTSMEAFLQSLNDESWLVNDSKNMSEGEIDHDKLLATPLQTKPPVNKYQQLPVFANFSKTRDN